ncbi:Retrovirus-related Pol polyprotein from transposon TNT 1-94 [Vitis vinifera]|uniref:Retrovirus-related Pol polyprotein from transposon TNT 1-94 n=1 Tax=Vitis vinifera TaxID=29760 RepID=A0A438IQC0_VITVI|nr:Retrovirus-related Pol polyprotein from transposon TNT 1-94 [Vitis vinifera]
MKKKNANRCSDVLELIHTDICGPFPTPSWNGQQYFITFIDDYSRYDYLYLIHEKSQSLDVFKNFKAEVENQLSKKIKAVRSDRGGEYYGRYDGSGEQHPGPFAKYLMECGIVPQYTMPGTLSQNGVAERRNRTLKDMSITGIQDTPEIPPAQVMEPIQVHQEMIMLYISKNMSLTWVWKTIQFQYKARLVAKGFTQREGIDYKETFSPVSSKDSFRIIMALVAHYDLELHQMDVKTVFLNGNIDETIYMVQPENFESNDSKQLVCRLKRSIYGLKQASRQWYRKFDQVITSFGFKENTVDQCIYLKFSGNKFIILVLYVDDILLASSDVGLLHETKRFLSSKFDMKDLGNASFVLGIQIHRDCSRGIFGLSQKAYIDKVLSRFGMSNCAPGDTPVAKGDKFSLHQCPKNELEKKDMERFLYALAVGSLMYAQVCTRPDIAYIVGMLGRYLSNPGMDHWKKAKRVMRYLQRTKDYMLTYRRSSHLEIVGYSDSDFVGCLDSRRSTSGYIFMLAG